MSKTLVTIIGLVVSIGVIALGFFLVALPLFMQSLGVDAQTATVANTNAIYQAQVDNLRAEQENIDEINQSVSALRTQIPAVGQFDDVFEVVANAAAATGVSVVSITAGTAVEFVPRTGPDDASTVPEPTPDPAPTDTDPAEPEIPEGSAVPSNPTAEGRQQVDFAIQVSAVDMAQATAFLDALRAGPRLLNSIEATAVADGEGSVAVRVTALTYIAEG